MLTESDDFKQPILFAHIHQLMLTGAPALTNVIVIFDVSSIQCTTFDQAKRRPLSTLLCSRLIKCKYTQRRVNLEHGFGLFSCSVDLKFPQIQAISIDSIRTSGHPPLNKGDK